MKKRILSLFLALTLCLTLLPTSAFAEGGDVSISDGVIGGETGGEGGGVLVPPGGSTGEGGGIYTPPSGPAEGGGGTYIPEEDTRTEIWCVSKPDSIGRSYDGTTDGGTIPIDLTFTDGTKEYTALLLYCALFWISLVEERKLTLLRKNTKEQATTSS